MTDRLPCVEIEPQQQAKASVIWLHGLGADGHDFEGIVPALDIPPSRPTRFVFPHAPVRPITLNNGHPMRAWCDIETLDFSRYSDMSRLDEALAQVHVLIQHEVARGVPTEAIVLAGFSQGGAVALAAGVGYPEKLAGITGLSTYFPLYQATNWHPPAANHTTPIFLAHGLQDRVVLPKFGLLSRDMLVSNKYQVEWREYEMDHSVCNQEINDISRFLKGL